MKILKRIGSITLDVLIVIFFAFALIVVIAAANKKNGMLNFFGYTANSVQSESMSGTFEKGDLVFGKFITSDSEIIADSEDYHNNSIISFYQKVNGTTIVNTHRVVESRVVDGITFYVTQGDNRKTNPNPDDELKTINEVLCVYTGHIGFVGGAIDFIRQPVGFILILVLPLSAVIIYEGYRIIKIIMDNKKQEAVEAVSEANEEAVKRYLAEHNIVLPPDANLNQNKPEENKPQTEAEQPVTTEEVKVEDEKKEAVVADLTAGGVETPEVKEETKEVKTEPVEDKATEEVKEEKPVKKPAPKKSKSSEAKKTTKKKSTVSSDGSETKKKTVKKTTKKDEESK